ncbi:MAG TPA: PIG-L deacetylase family protein [Acidimicrobiales bacterium]|nr:PIG-L deacetylase family protein [Acidimicrobiales bacterium]
MPTTDDAVRRILVVTAHPDDVDFGAGGSVAAWTGAGIQVDYCVITDGDAGGFDPDVPRAELAAVRRREQLAAAEVLGVNEVEFLGYPDGRLEVSLELRRDVARAIRRVRPDRVVCQSPERTWDRIYASHPDHLAAGEAALCAVYPDARNEFAFPELLEEGFASHVVPEVWVMLGPAPDVHVDVTDTVADKVKALLCHVSQHREPHTLEERIRAWGAAQARAGGLAEGRLAETYRRVATA